MNGSQGYQHYNPGQNNAGYMSSPLPPLYRGPAGSDSEKNINSVPPCENQSFYSPQGDIIHPSDGIRAYGAVTPTVVTSQPVVIIGQTPVGYPPSDYLGFSIFTLICCCLPLGIAALVFSIGTRDAISYGNLEEAQRKSLISRNLNISALVFGIAIIAVVIILQFTVFIYHT